MLESRKMAPYGSGRSPLGILYLGGKNCCSWHRLSPGAKVADHGRAAQAGGRPEKTESERLHRPSGTLTTSKTRAYSEFPLLSSHLTWLIELLTYLRQSADPSLDSRAPKPYSL